MLSGGKSTRHYTFLRQKIVQKIQKKLQDNKILVQPMRIWEKVEKKTAICTYIFVFTGCLPEDTPCTEYHSSVLQKDAD